MICSPVLRVLFLATFALRVLVPAGLMPADMTDGWFLKLCPDGVSAEWMAGLNGDHHHHHHEEDGAQDSSCELGGGLGASAANQDAFSFADNFSSETHSSNEQTVIASVAPLYVHGARAPPIFSLT